MGLEQIWLLEKLIKRFKMKPIRASFEVGFLLIIFIVICFFGVGYLPEKGRQAASNTTAPPLPIKDKPKLATISSGEIVLPGPGTYFVATENMTAPDNIIEKISGLSMGDKVTLQVTTNDGEIVIRESSFIRMQSPIFCLRSIHDKITFSNIGGGVCVEDSRINIGDGC